MHYVVHHPYIAPPLMSKFSNSYEYTEGNPSLPLNQNLERGCYKITMIQNIMAQLIHKRYKKWSF